MKKILFLAAAVLSLTACSNESIESTVSEVSTSVKKDTKIAFTFLLPGDPVTYSGTVDHSEAERKIERLDIYQFNGEAENAQLEKIHFDVLHRPVGPSQPDKYKAEVFVETKTALEKKRFVLVTNNIEGNPGYISGLENLPVKTTAVEGITLSDFKKKTTDALTTSPLNGKPLVMTDNQNITITTGAEASVTAKLVRVMARIDIRNEDHNFDLKQVQLRNSKAQAYLLPKDLKEGEAPTPGDPSAPASVVSLPLITLPVASSDPEIGFSTTSDGIKTYEHVFYPYPSNTGTNLEEGPVIVLKGTLRYDNPVKTAEVTYEYKLKKDETNYFGFKRNTLYTLVIKKAISEQELLADFKVNKWKYEEVEGSVVKVLPPRLIGAADKPTIFTADINKKIIKVNKNGGEVELYVESNQPYWKAESTEDWASGFATQYMKTDVEKKSISFLKQVLRFNVKPNPTSSKRTLTLKLSLNYDKKKYTTLVKVEQAGS